MRTTHEAPTEYPPPVWEPSQEFVAPGPVSRPLAAYLAMCAPRSRRSRREPARRDPVGAAART